MSGNHIKRFSQQELGRAPWRNGRLWLGVLVLLISALSISLFVGPTIGIATAYPDGARSIADAWAVGVHILASSTKNPARRLKVPPIHAIVVGSGSAVVAEGALIAYIVDFASKLIWGNTHLQDKEGRGNFVKE